MNVARRAPAALRENMLESSHDWILGAQDPQTSVHQTGHRPQCHETQYYAACQILVAVGSAGSSEQKVNATSLLGAWLASAPNPLAR